MLNQISQYQASTRQFVCDHLAKVETKPGKELVIAGGFADKTVAVSSQRGLVTSLAANHEEADTRILLHAAEAHTQGYHCKRHRRVGSTALLPLPIIPSSLYAIRDIFLTTICGYTHN